MLHGVHDATCSPRLLLIGTPGCDRRRLGVQVRTQSKSIECSFNVVSIVFCQSRFNVVYSVDRPLVISRHRQTDRQTDRQADRQRDRQTDTGRQKERDTG